MRLLLAAVSLAVALSAAAEPSWPAPSAPLVEVPLPKAPRKVRLFLDAGHGAAGNRGAPSVFCEEEEDFTLRAAQALKTRLEATGRFKVRLSREGDQQPGYRQRVAEAERWHADAFLSLHSDVRGEASPYQPAPGLQCWRNDAAPGFAVLWSDAAPTSLRARRSELARRLSERLIQAGLLPYSGDDYPGLYDPAPTPGAFVDRHRPGARIYVLRRPQIPSIILETHHALDLEEATRWREPRTYDAVAAAVGAGLIDWLWPAEESVNRVATRALSRRSEAPSPSTRSATAREPR